MNKVLSILILMSAAVLAQTPGTVGVYDSTTTFYVGFTAPSTLPATTTWTLPSSDAAGCMTSNGAAILSFQSCLPQGLTGSIQFKGPSGGLSGSANLVWDDLNQRLTVVGISANPAIQVNGGFLQTSGGYTSSSNSWQGITSTMDGSLLRAYSLDQNANGLNGGYIDMAPVLYNPYNSPTPCLDAWGNIVTQPLPLNGLSGFATHHTIMWVSTSPTMPPSGCGTALPVEEDYGLNINSYFLARGGLATDNELFNSIHSLRGGVTSVSFTAGGLYPAGTVTACCGTLSVATYIGGYMQIGHSSGPPAPGTVATVNNPLTSGDGINQGTMYWDDTLACVNVFNGTSWGCLAGGGGGGGTPGGPNTSIQFNNAGAFGGSSALFWNNASQLLTVTGLPSTAGIAVASAYVQADGGFLATVGTATNYNAIQAPGGGMQAKSFTATNYVQTGHNTVVPGSGGNPITPADSLHPGAMFWNDTSGCEQVYSGSAWACLGSGGSTSPGGASTAVQFNNAGSFGGSTNFTWDNAGQRVTITAASSAVSGLIISTGFAQADQGFLATTGTAVNYNVIQAPTGGMQALSFTASNYIQAGQHSGAPTPTTADTFHPGAMYYDTSALCLEVYNGSAFSCVGSGGSGSPGSPNTAVQFNNSGAFGGSVNFTWDNTNRLLNILPNSTNIALQLQGSTNILDMTQDSVYSLAGGLSNHFLWQLGQSGGAGLLRVSNGTGTGGYDSLGAQIFGSGSTGLLQATTFQSGATGTTMAFRTANSNVQINGNGVISTVGGLNSIGAGVNVSSMTAFNSIQTSGGVYAQGAFTSSNFPTAPVFTTTSGSIVITGDGGIQTSNSILAFQNISAAQDIVAFRHYRGDGGITPSVSGPFTVAAGSTDIRGTLTCNSCGPGSTAILTFASTYSSAPFCVASAGSSAASVGVPSPATSFNVIFNLGGGASNINYICIQ